MPSIDQYATHSAAWDVGFASRKTESRVPRTGGSCGRSNFDEQPAELSSKPLSSGPQGLRDVPELDQGHFECELTRPYCIPSRKKGGLEA